jgi:hypothetical protein
MKESLPEVSEEVLLCIKEQKAWVLSFPAFGYCLEVLHEVMILGTVAAILQPQRNKQTS